MKFLKKKTMAILISMLLVRSIAIPVLVFPAANAHTPPWTVLAGFSLLLPQTLLV